MCSVSLLIDAVLEWNDGLTPGWVVPWDNSHRVDLCELHYVQDLELLEFEEGIEDAIVELAEESKGVSVGQVLLLGVVDGDLDVKIWLLVGSHGVWNLLQELIVWRALQFLLKLSEFTRLVQSPSSIWVQVSKIVEVFFS